MTRTALLKLALTLAVLAIAATVGHGDPPTVVDPGAAAHPGAAQGPPLASDLQPLPRVASCAHGGCLDDPNDPWVPPCGDDEIELVVEDGALHVLHQNATYNCCCDDIVIVLTVEGDVLHLTEVEIVPDPCYCICCYNVQATIVDLAPGTYTVEFCWYDYETDEILCQWEDITIGRGGDGTPRLDPLPPIDPNDIAHQASARGPPVEMDPVGPPYVEQYANSGCLDDANDPWFPPCGDDEIELVVEGSTLYVFHRNATYNCCPDEIVISLAVEGNQLLLTEEEILSNPCWCICCYNLEATVVNLAPGTYTVQFCWFDYEAFELTCHTEDILVPGN